MKMQKLFDDLRMEGFSMSENPLIADLSLGGHVIGYGRHFEKCNNAQHKSRFLLGKVKSLVTNHKVFRVGQFIGDVRLNV